MSLPRTGSLIEGVDDQLIYVVFGTLITVSSLVVTGYYWLSQRFTPQQIDPANRETVDSVRQEINQTRRNTTNMRPREGEMTCPICMDTVRYAVETNCGHVFCGRCMITYWRHGHWVRGLKCPVCRTQVNLMLRYFSTEEQTTPAPEREEIVQEVNTYNRRFSGDPIPWMDYLRDLPTLLRHLASEFFSIGGMVLMFRLRILVLFVAVVLYFLSPLDIIPEAVFGILGFLDDLFILLLLTVYVSILYRQFVVQRAQNI